MIEVLVFTTSSKVGKPNRLGGEYNVLQRLDRFYLVYGLSGKISGRRDRPAQNGAPNDERPLARAF
jgi:hypothetical protein